MLDLSVVVVTYNSAATITDCLTSLLENSAGLNLDVWVVDNQSTDNTIELVSQQFPTVQLIASQVNGGFGAGCNLGIKASPGRNILLLNPDTITPPGTIQVMSRFLDETPQAGIVGCVNLDQQGHFTLSCYPPMSLATVAWSHLQLFKILPNHVLGKYRQQAQNTANEPFPVGWVMGSCFMFKRALVEQIGLFDENFFLSSEETDYAYRAAQLGWQSWFLPGCHVIHYGGVSGKQVPFVRASHQYLSKLYYFTKHHSRFQFYLLKALFFLEILLTLAAHSLRAVRGNPRSRAELAMYLKIFGLVLKYRQLAISDQQLAGKRGERKEERGKRREERGERKEETNSKLKTQNSLTSQPPTPNPQPPKVLFVHNALVTFVANDLQLLREHYRVEEYFVKSDLINPFAVFMKVRRADLVFGWFASLHTLLPVLFAWILRKPSVVVLGGYDVASEPDINYGHQRGGIRKLVNRLICKAATGLISVSQFNYQECLNNALVAPPKLKLIYNAVPITVENISPEPRTTVLTVGKVDTSNLERKGLRLFVETARLLPDVQFVLVGAWADNAIDTLKKISPSNVTFTGRVSEAELEEEFNRAAVYVQVSRHEAFGLAVAQAMLHGCLPVLSKSGALPEVGGDIAFYIEERKPESVAASIRAALQAAHDPTRAQFAHQRIRANFSLDQRRAQLYQFLDELLDKD